MHCVLSVQSGCHRDTCIGTKLFSAGEIEELECLKISITNSLLNSTDIVGKLFHLESTVKILCAMRVLTGHLVIIKNIMACTAVWDTKQTYSSLIPAN